MKVGLTTTSRLRVGITAVAGVPQRRLRSQMVRMRPEGLDLSPNPLDVTQQEIALLARRLIVHARGWPGMCACPRSRRHSAQAPQRLHRVEVLLAVAAVPVLRVALDRANQPDLFVVAQRRLTQPAAPSHILDRESCHSRSKPAWQQRTRGRTTLARPAKLGS
jgi:hypothetical protein